MSYSPYPGQQPGGDPNAYGSYQYQTSPQPGANPGRRPLNKLQKALIGCGGCLGVIIVLGGLSAALTAGHKTATTSSHNTANTSSSPKYTPHASASIKPSATAKPTPKGAVTLRNFGAIQNGMSLQQVEALLGNGQMTTESGSGSNTLTVYSWSTPDGLGAVTVVFQNNQVTSKTQFGLS